MTEESPRATELIVRAVIRCEDAVLVVRLRDEQWSFLPGGHVEAGEPLEDALIRELAEELGAVAVIGDLAAVVEHGYLDNGLPRHELNVIFHVTLDDPDPTGQEDHLEFHWVNLSDVPDLKLQPEAAKRALTAASALPTPFWHAWRP